LLSFELTNTLARINHPHERVEMNSVKIADYGLSEEFGYLPHYDPAQRLSPGNEEWDEFALEIPKLLMGNDFRKRVHALPDFNVSALKTQADISRAMMILSYIGQSYQWSDNSPATVFPKKTSFTLV